MSGQAKMKQAKSAGKRVTKRKRMMTDKESSALLESASQALAMVQGTKLKKVFVISHERTVIASGLGLLQFFSQSSRTESLIP
jgi:hypothetical protein